MAQFKYIKHGVKRKHEIIEGFLPLLEKIAQFEGIQKMVPAKISSVPKKTVSYPYLKLQQGTLSGFKLLAQGKGCIQEVFVVVEGDQGRRRYYACRNKNHYHQFQSRSGYY